MRRRDVSSAALQAAIALVATTECVGCASPFGSCDASDTTLASAFSPTNLTLESDGGFVITDPDDEGRYPGSYASCRDYCAIQAAVESVTTCDGPTYVSSTTEPPSWSITCDVETVSCNFPWIISPPTITAGGGRMTQGVQMPASPRARRHGWTEASAAGQYFASMAAEEAAAVMAFERLARELAAHDAPPRLVVEARRAARDEIRHTLAMSALAARFGAEVVLPKARTLEVRPLDAFIAENAAEGCVRETFGAILLAYQAAHAFDPRVRRVLRQTARDEARHAALAWQIARWDVRRRGRRARTDATRAMRTAVRQLHGSGVPTAIPEGLGVPSPPRMLRLLRGAQTRILGRREWVVLSLR